jgi:hypothetical protein
MRLSDEDSARMETTTGNAINAKSTNTIRPRRLQQYNSIQRKKSYDTFKFNNDRSVKVNEPKGYI